MKKNDKVRDRLTEVHHAAIDMEAEKENTLTSVMESIVRVSGNSVNSTALRKIGDQVQAALNNLQRDMYAKLASLGNSLWKKTM